MPTPQHTPTIIDVAKAAGVSKSTVSRVLDERLPPSRSPAADRVREAAQRLGYRQNRFASSLRRQQTQTIGVIVPRLSDTVMAMLYERIAEACAATGRFAIVATTDDDPHIEQQAIERLLDQRVDGLILTTARLDDDTTARLRDRGIPFSLALRSDGTSPAATGDDELGGYLATRHLIDLGHRQIALIGGPSYASSALGRRDGFSRAMREAGHAEPERMIFESAFSMQSGESVMRDIISSGLDASAVFAINDNTAVGALAAAQSMGLRVPEDLSVVGYNDIPLSARLAVPLTSVRVPFDYLASAALTLLDESRASKRAREIKASPTLIPRGSTRSPAQRA